MHTDLSAHLHTPRCNELIELLKKCHETNTFSKFFGACNSQDNAVLRCLKEERIARSAANRAKARERHEEIRRRMNEELQ